MLDPGKTIFIGYMIHALEGPVNPHDRNLFTGLDHKLYPTERAAKDHLQVYFTRTMAWCYPLLTMATIGGCLILRTSGECVASCTQDDSTANLEPVLTVCIGPYINYIRILTFFK